MTIQQQEFTFKDSVCIHKNYSRIFKGSHEVVALFNSVPCLTPVQTFPVSFSTHSISQRASRTFTASAEVSLELLQSVSCKSFLISSRSLFSWVLGSTDRSSFLVIESPLSIQILCRTMHARVTVQTRSLLLSFFQKSTLHLPFSCPYALSVTMRAQLRR